MSKSKKNRSTANHAASAEPKAPNGSPNEGFIDDIDTFTKVPEDKEEEAAIEETAAEEPVAEEALPEEEAAAPAQETPAEPENEPILKEEPAEDFSKECIIMGASTPEEKKEEAPADKEPAAQEATPDAEAEEKTEEKDEEESSKIPLRFTPFVYAITLLGVFAICFLFYYLHARQEPAKATKEYLTSIQSLDFDQMESLLEEKDLTALEDADLSNPAYHDFFTDVNERMSFAITRIDFGLTRSDAKVTARIHHVDGTELYEQVLTNFLLGIVSDAFSGENIALEETEGKLATLLADAYAELPLRYTDTEISYPMVKTEEGWKVAALDDITVKVMSANFKSIQEEIENILNTGSQTRSIGGEEGSEKSVINLTPTDVINIATQEYEVTYDRYTISEDLAGDNCLLYFYTYKNLSEEPSSAINHLTVKVFQDGKELAPGNPNDNEPSLGNYYKQVEPGQTLTICEAFSLPEVSNVSIQVTDKNYGDSATQVLRIQ